MPSFLQSTLLSSATAVEWVDVSCFWFRPSFFAFPDGDFFFLWNEVVWKTNVRGNRLRKLYANKCLWKISGRYAWGEHGAYESAFQSYHKFRLDAPNEGLRRMEKILSELKKIVTSAWTGECYEDFPVPGE